VPGGKNRRHRKQCSGRERPQELFGRLKAQKVGSLPPDLGLFPPGIFFSGGSLSLSFPEDASATR
jgi:hypothetical protein